MKPTLYDKISKFCDKNFYKIGNSLMALMVVVLVISLVASLNNDNVKKASDFVVIYQTKIKPSAYDSTWIINTGVRLIEEADKTHPGEHEYYASISLVKASDTSRVLREQYIKAFPIYERLLKYYDSKILHHNKK